VILPSTFLGYTTWPLTTLGACRQIRFEASPLCFANITFDLRRFTYSHGALRILKLGAFELVLVRDGTAALMMDDIRVKYSMYIENRKILASLKRIYITAFGNEVEPVYDKASGLFKECKC
jgi:hypothetical protein